MQEAAIPAPKTHDLEKLLDLCAPLEPTWKSTISDLSVLTDYAVDYRYPGISAGPREATLVVKTCANLRKIFRGAFRVSKVRKSARGRSDRENKKAGYK